MAEEYAMQRAWLEDADKLTFILLARRAPPSPFPSPSTCSRVPLSLPLCLIAFVRNG
jgi:hypothetical protein